MRSSNWLDAKRLTEVARLCSDTSGFLLARQKADNNLAKALVVFSFFLGAHLWLMSFPLELISRKFESASGYVASNVVFVFFVALVGHLAMKMLRVESSYYSVLHATFYMFGPILLLTALGVSIWFQALLTQKLSFFGGLLLVIIISWSWAYRAWSAMAMSFGASKKRTVAAFVVANIIYTPVTWAFWALSGVYGRVA